MAHLRQRSGLGSVFGSPAPRSGSSAISPPSGRPSAIQPLSRSSAGICAVRSTWSREARRMMNLAEYRRRSESLADFLPLAALVTKGVVLNKDGSFQRTARFRGPDLDSATAAELVAITGRLNNALRRLGSGWAVFVEAQRNSVEIYPACIFPDPVSGLVEAERRADFSESGAHFES